MAGLELHVDSTPENLPLLGTPDKHARPSLLAVGFGLARTIENGDGMSIAVDRIAAGAGGGKAESDNTVVEELTNLAVRTLGTIPIWIQAALRLGTRFVRVAAVGAPPAFRTLPMTKPAATHAASNTSRVLTNTTSGFRIP